MIPTLVVLFDINFRKIYKAYHWRMVIFAKSGYNNRIPSNY
jgi:hypothetical protein